MGDEASNKMEDKTDLLSKAIISILVVLCKLLCTDKFLDPLF